MPFKTELCRSCGKEIIFVRTRATDSLMPIDAQPCVDGNIVLDRGGKAVVLSGDLFEEIPTGDRYRSHFSTCTDPGKWRRTKR